MSGRETEEFEKFVQNLIRPVPADSGQAPAHATNITIITGSVRCKIYVGTGGTISTDVGVGRRERPNQP